jgi:hypothetical protein
MKLLPILAGIAAVTVTLTGCASTPAPKPTTPTVVTVTGDTALLNFIDLAHRSCGKALDTGVTENVNDGAMINVMVPKSAAVSDYSAVTISKDAGVDNPQLIFETDIFETCYYANKFSMAADGGVAVTDLGVTVTQQGDSWTVVEAVVEDDGKTPTSFTTKYTSINGVISQSVSDNASIVITYDNYKEFLPALEKAVVLLNE